MVPRGFFKLLEYVARAIRGNSRPFGGLMAKKEHTFPFQKRLVRDSTDLRRRLFAASSCQGEKRVGVSGV
jgi:hypothetical protein